MMATLWFILLFFMLAMYVVQAGTDLGVGMVHLLVARNDAERAQAIHSIRPVWKPNEVWLIAAGGTMLMAFPAALAASFSGFYLALMVVLWLLAFRGLGVELRHQIADALWMQFWDVAVSIASLLLTLCLGAALGNVVRGVPLNQEGVFFEPLWTDFLVGEQTGILDWYTVLVGVVAVAALAHQGALWLGASTDGPIQERAKRLSGGLCAVLLFLLLILDAASLAAQPELRAGLGLHPWGVVFPIVAVAGLAASFFLERKGKHWRAYLASGIALAAMLATAAIGMYPCILPARNPAFALTVNNAAAPTSSLTTALYWWLPGMVLIGAYFTYIYATLPSRSHEGAPVSGVLEFQDPNKLIE
jgi:cytochrome d ubiquinol oxidase subunit II